MAPVYITIYLIYNKISKYENSISLVKDSIKEVPRYIFSEKSPSTYTIYSQYTHQQPNHSKEQLINDIIRMSGGLTNNTHKSQNLHEHDYNYIRNLHEDVCSSALSICIKNALEHVTKNYLPNYTYVIVHEANQKIYDEIARNIYLRYPFVYRAFTGSNFRMELPMTDL